MYPNHSLFHLPRYAPNLPTIEASGKMVETPKNRDNAIKIIKIVSFKIAYPLHVNQNLIITDYLHVF